MAILQSNGLVTSVRVTVDAFANISGNDRQSPQSIFDRVSTTDHKIHFQLLLKRNLPAPIHSRGINLSQYLLAGSQPFPQCHVWSVKWCEARWSFISSTVCSVYR